ncbi:MAG: chain-length determining protein, partial [Sphingomonadaceae bacterium]|nr:chain-length determining protein [Sphingomonadaceae bacterium]
MNGIYEEIRVALHQIWRRRWLALLVAWGIALAGWLVIALIPNSYESKSRVFVQLQSVLTEEIGITERAQQADFSRIQQTLAAAPVLESIVRRTDLAQRVTSEEEVRRLAARLRDRIVVTAEPNNTFEIATTWSGGGFSDAGNARLARQINQGLLDAFVEQNLAGTRTESTQSIRFLDRQISERQRQLQQVSQRSAELEAGFQTTLPGSGPLSARIDAARAEMRRIESDLVPAQSSLSAVRAQMSGTSPTIALPGTYVPAGGGGGAATAQLNALQAE